MDDSDGAFVVCKEEQGVIRASFLFKDNVLLTIPNGKEPVSGFFEEVENNLFVLRLIPVPWTASKHSLPPGYVTWIKRNEKHGIELLTSQDQGNKHLKFQITRLDRDYDVFMARVKKGRKGGKVSDIPSFNFYSYNSDITKDGRYQTLKAKYEKLKQYDDLKLMLNHGLSKVSDELKEAITDQGASDSSSPRQDEVATEIHEDNGKLQIHLRLEGERTKSFIDLNEENSRNLERIQDLEDEKGRRECMISNLQDDKQRLQSERDRLAKQVVELQENLDKISLQSQTRTGVVLNCPLPLPETIAHSWRGLIIHSCILEQIAEFSLDVEIFLNFVYTLERIAREIVHDKETVCMQALGYDHDETNPQIRIVRRQLQNNYDVWSERLLTEQQYIDSEISFEGLNEQVQEKVLEFLKLFTACALNDPVIHLEDRVDELPSDFDWRKVPKEHWIDDFPKSDADLEHVKCAFPALIRGEDVVLEDRHYFFKPSRS